MGLTPCGSPHDTKTEALSVGQRKCSKSITILSNFKNAKGINLKCKSRISYLHSHSKLGFSLAWAWTNLVTTVPALWVHMRSCLVCVLLWSSITSDSCNLSTSPTVISELWGRWYYISVPLMADHPHGFLFAISFNL